MAKWEDEVWTGKFSPTPNDQSTVGNMKVFRV